MPYRINSPLPVSRYPDWDSRLAGWLETAVSRPFCWGRFDCFLAAADALAVQTGVDIAGPLRGTYSTPEGALRQLLKRGCRDVSELMAVILQRPAVIPAQLQRGDIAMARLPAGSTLGVIWGGAIWLPAPAGLQACPLALADSGWRVTPCLY